MKCIDTNTLIVICTCAISLTQFLFWRYIAKNKAYESEKGKNIATKEDIGEITKEIEIIKNEISFENQRRHIYIEQRTNRFIEILHLTDELQVHKKQLLYYLYDKRSIDKLSLLIDNSNKTSLKLIHECRILMVSIDDETITDCIDNLRNSSQKYVTFICYIASTAISHLTEWNTSLELAIQKENDAFFVKQASEHRECFIKTRNEFENEIKNKEEELYNDIIKYLALLKSLFNKEFHLKFDFSKSKAKM